MTYSQQSHEAAVARHPMDSLNIVGIDDEADAQFLLDEAREQVLRERANFADNIEGGSDHTGEPPLYTAISHITGQIHELESARRRLIAFGRHGVTGKPYSYAGLGTAAGKSETWAKEQADDSIAKTAALAAAAELRPIAEPAPGPADPETAAIRTLTELMDDADTEFQQQFLAGLNPQRVRLTQHELDDAACTRIINYLHARYTTKGTSL